MSEKELVFDLFAQLLVEWQRWKSGETGRWERIESIMRHLDRLNAHKYLLIDE